MSFREALDKHLRAIQERDLRSLAETLPAVDLILIMSDGRLVRTTREFLELHRGWFEQTGWSLDAQVVSTRETADMALAVLRLDYHDVRPDGLRVRELSHLTLAFARQDGRWVMVHDQNTPIKNPDAASA